MSHTKGPWHVEESSGIMVYVVSEDGTVVSRSIRGVDSVLIAAAPDLLAACEELLLVAGTYSPVDMYDWERVSASIERAKAAIKKARGEL